MQVMQTLQSDANVTNILYKFDFSIRQQARLCSEWWNFIRIAKNTCYNWCKWCICYNQ